MYIQNKRATTSKLNGIQQRFQANIYFLITKRNVKDRGIGVKRMKETE